MYFINWTLSVYFNKNLDCVCGSLTVSTSSTTAITTTITTQYVDVFFFSFFKFSLPSLDE